MGACLHCVKPRRDSDKPADGVDGLRYPVEVQAGAEDGVIDDEASEGHSGEVAAAVGVNQPRMPTAK